MKLSSILSRRIVTPALVLLVGSAGFAGLVTWDGGTSGNNTSWAATGNWNPNALPTLNDTVQFNLLSVGTIQPPTNPMTLSSTTIQVQSVTFTPGFNATNSALVQNNGASASNLRLYSDTNSILLDFQPGSGSFTIQNGTTSLLNTQIHKSGTINVNTGGTLNILGALNNSTVSGANAAPVITKTGGGKLVLGSGASNFTGSYIIDTGTVQLGNALALGNLLNALTINANGTLDLNGLSPTVGPLSGSGIITSNATGTAEISVGNGGLAGSSTTFSGMITDGALAGQIVALRKVGASGLVIEGTQPFTGATTVSGGSLLINAALPATASVAVAGGAIFGGTGSVNASASVNVAASGTIAPGAGIGTLSTGPVGFSDAAIFSLEIGATTADQLLIAGAASLAGTIVLDLTLLADPVDDTTFTILNASAPLTGYAGGARFAYLGNSLDEGETFTATTGGFTQDFLISYSADAGNDVTLRTVPEPGVLGSLLGGAGLLLGLRRRAK